MTEISRPWVGTTIGDAGPYSADQWASMYRNAFNASDPDAGILIGSGVDPEPGLSVVPTGPASMQLTVKAGAALIHGTYYELTADQNVTIGGNASGVTRIDSVVLRKTWATQTIRLAVVAGTPAASPVPPTLTQNAGVTWESALADITVINGAVSLTAVRISPRSTFANAGQNVYIPNLQNTSGVTLNTGDLVKWNGPASVGLCDLTTDAAAPNNVAGVWVGRTPNNGYGKVLTRGIGYVRSASTNGSRNYIFIPSYATPGQCDILSNIGGSMAFSFARSIGRALEDFTSAGLVKTYVDISPTAMRSWNFAIVDNNANYTTASAVFVDITSGGGGLGIDPIVQAAAGSGGILVTLQGAVEHSVSGTLIHFDFKLNGAGWVNQSLAALYGTFANGLFTVRGLGAGVPVPVHFQGIIQPGRLGSVVTITPRWRTAAPTASFYAGAGGAANDIPLTLSAFEIG